MDFELQSTFGLTIRDDSSSTAADMVWEKLALVAGYNELGAPPAEAVVQLLNEHANPTLGNADLFKQLDALADSASSADAGPNAARLSVILLALKPELLAAVIAAEVNIATRRHFLHNCATVVSVEAIGALASAAAQAYDRPYSLMLVVLLDKLSHAAHELPAETRPVAESAYRGVQKRIFDAWSSSSVEAAAASSAGGVAPEPVRLLQIALETDAEGHAVWVALARLTATDDGVRRVLDITRLAPPLSKVAQAMARRFATPELLGALLREEPVDFAIADLLLPHLDRTAACAVLLDGIAEAKSRVTRHGLLEGLGSFGPDVATMVTERLGRDERWYVQRNMLCVLREANCKFDKATIAPFATHTDARVRREATLLLLNDPIERDRALTAALRDNDPQILKIGLRAARASMPESVVPVLAKRVFEPEFPPEFRPAALYLLGRSSSILAGEALLRFAMIGTSLLGRPKLAPKSTEMLVALSTLARVWPSERRASSLIASARESKDPEIVKAVSGGEKDEPLVERDVLDDE